MWRLLHLLALAALIGSAGYVYGVKYRSIYAREQLVEAKRKIDREREEIAVLKAEFASLTRPDRIQALADRQLAMAPLELSSVARFDDLPYPGPKVDFIGQKIDALALPGEPSTPPPANPGATTPVR